MHTHHVFARLALALMLASSNAAYALTDPSWEAISPAEYTVSLHTPELADSHITWNLPGSTTAMLSQRSITATAIAPSAVDAQLGGGTSGQGYVSVSVQEPIALLVSAAHVVPDLQPATVHANALVMFTQGGFRLTAPVDAVSGLSGGYVDITHLAINLQDHVIYADMSGGNGQSLIGDLPLWTFSGIVGDAFLQAHSTTPLKDCVGTCGFDQSEAHFTLTGLQMSQGAGDYLPDFIAQSLGQAAGGSGFAQALLNNAGSISVAISVVPEPSSSMLMALGLFGLAGLRRLKHRRINTPR